MKNKLTLSFLILALLALCLGVFFGLFASLQYVMPEFLKEIIPFNKMRPLHLSSVTSWIILAATGSIYFFLIHVEKLNFYSKKLVKIHFIIFLLTGISIYISLFVGKMEGREYLAYTPILTLPILVSWVLFGINYFKTIRKSVSSFPVYYWMWGTGIVFMIYHLSEAHLWIFPYFREHIIKDLTIQWKSYGSFVGSWNMLVYGISIYLMSKIKNDVNLAHGKTVFFFYFLGLTNLMFGWAHHTYLIPSQTWIRYVAYGISMTEWVVLAHIIYSWKKSLSQKNKEDNSMTYKFLLAADFWIFINIIIALLFSIPTINYFTHGTHITVAHSMGTTIGINTTILMASLFFIISKINPSYNSSQFIIKKGYQLFNISLFLFLLTLFVAGIQRSKWTYFNDGSSFSQMQDSLYFVYIAFFVFGIGLFTAIYMLAIPLLRQFLKSEELS